jgi:Nucleotidyl transferase AbiEii toxin, Type IV TA system
MKYSSATAFRQALDDRLKIEAQSTGLSLARLRKRVAFELFLRRLVAVAPDRWVLKGALALDLRLDVATRPTKDIDLGRDDDEQDAIADMTAAQQIVLDDYFTFSGIRTTVFDDTDDFTAIRFHMTAQLAGRTFEEFIVDIGFFGAFTWSPETIQTSDLLSFAGIERVQLPAVPISQHLAEKVHAYTRVYGERQQPSTRPKDLVDILLISQAESVTANLLRDALESTFRVRNRQILPARLPAPPPAWGASYARLARDVGVTSDLSAAFDQAAGFFDPVLSEEAAGRWDPATAKWDASTASAAVRPADDP